MRTTYYPVIPDLGVGFEGVRWMECWREVCEYEIEHAGALFAPVEPICRMVTYRY